MNKKTAVHTALLLLVSLMNITQGLGAAKMKFERYGSSINALSDRRVTDSVLVSSKLYYANDLTYFELSSAAYDDTGDYWPAQVFEKITFPDSGGLLKRQLDDEVRLLDTRFNENRTDIMRAYVVERTRADLLQSDKDWLALELKIAYLFLSVISISILFFYVKKK